MCRKNALSIAQGCSCGVGGTYMLENDERALKLPQESSKTVQVSARSRRFRTGFARVSRIEACNISHDAEPAQGTPIRRVARVVPRS